MYEVLRPLETCFLSTSVEKRRGLERSRNISAWAATPDPYMTVRKKIVRTGQRRWRMIGSAAVMIAVIAKQTIMAKGIKYCQ